MQQNTWSFPAPQDKQFGLLHPHPLNNCILLHPHPYCVFVWFFLRTCVPNVASFSGLSFLIAPSVFSNVYLLIKFISGKKLAVNIQSTFHSLDTCVGIAIPLQSIKLIFFTSLFICLFCKIVKFNIFYIGTFDQDTQCTPCSVDTFSPESSLDQCISCTICGSNEIPKTICNGITDTVCENKGKFSCTQQHVSYFLFSFFLHYQHQFRLVLFWLFLCCYFFLFLIFYHFFVSPVTFVLEGETYMC